MNSPRRDRSIGFLCLVVTAFGWALNWPLMKLLLQQWPPLFARGLAGTLAAVVFAALALGRRQSLKVPREAIPRLIFASFTNVFAWMGFSTMAMKYVTVGEGALIAYTMPIWAMLFAWPFLNVRPTLRDVAALALGIAGVALLLGADGFAFTAAKLTGITLALACAILFALGNVLNRQALPLPVRPGCFVVAGAGHPARHPNHTTHPPTRHPLLRLHAAGAEGFLLPPLVRTPAPPAAALGLARHAARPRDRRRPPPFHLGRAA